MKLRVVKLDVWGNRKDGFEVNDKWKTSFVLEVRKNASHESILKELEKVGYTKPGAFRKLEIEDLEGGEHVWLAVNEKKDGRFFCELLEEEEEK